MQGKMAIIWILFNMFLRMVERDYTLKLKYAARKGYVESSAMSIYWNGKEVSKVYAKDNKINDLAVAL